MAILDSSKTTVEAGSESGLLLNVKDLSIRFSASSSNVVDGISFEVRAGHTLAIVGESGCGKSLTALALMGLLPPDAEITAGQVAFLGNDLLRLSPNKWGDIRGNSLAMIFQEPMTSLNPMFDIGDQIAESVMRHQKVPQSDALQQALVLLRLVRIPAAEQRLKAFPHQLSGGTRQRVMIAMALANNPALLIADEPTTALDVTIQAQILALIGDLQKESGAGMILITHDLGVVAEVASDVAIMYAGHIVESGPVEEIFANPQHPYTIGLMGATPLYGMANGKLASIGGAVPSADNMPKGCRFATRCPFVISACQEKKPSLLLIGGEHSVACYRAPIEDMVESI